MSNDHQNGWNEYSRLVLKELENKGSNCFCCHTVFNGNCTLFSEDVLAILEISRYLVMGESDDDFLKYT